MTMWIVFLVFVVACWLVSGVRILPVGWRAVVLFLGKRTTNELGEGWIVAPFPFGITAKDCRSQTRKFTQVQVTTKDNVTVSVTGSVTFRINNLFTFLGITGFDTWLDASRQQAIRVMVKDYDQEDVLGMKEDVAVAVLQVLRDGNASSRGVEIEEVTLSEITLNETTAKAIALKEEEEHEQKGQEVEGKHLGALAGLIKEAARVNGVTLSDEQCYESALYITKKANPKNMYGVDPTTATLIGEVIARAMKGGR